MKESSLKNVYKPDFIRLQYKKSRREELKEKFTKKCL